jgi:hypothetical protein
MTRVLFFLLALCVMLPLCAEEPVTLSFDGQTAGISGFRKWWDTPQPGALVFDAVHRGVLVRFPGAAEGIAAKAREGYRVAKVEVVLPFAKADKQTYNGQPDSYVDRMSFGGYEHYAKVLPQWHAVAWALRRPWVADKDLGPTFNAVVNGASYWTKYGAQDETTDRFPRRFGPTEVSYKQTEGRMDVSATLTDPAFGKTPAARLRALSDCGFLLKKWEQYDFRFRKPGDGAYEWQVATGGFGLYINTPKLVVTFAPGASDIGALPPAANVPALAAQLQKTGKGGTPTAVMPTPEQLQKMLQTYAVTKPAWMPAWQWARVKELDAMGGGYRIPTKPDAYGKWIDEMLATPPRYWNGFDGPDRLQVYYQYKDALPRYVQDHYFRDYWTAWLEPDRPTSFFDHPQAMEMWYGGNNKYYNETGDWRGNASPYRDGYCYVISTENFNHWASLGALLGGDVIKSDYAMADGRHGLEYLPLRLWAWYDGSAQESIDHYYYALTLGCQKMFADFGPTPLDRLMAQSCLAKSMEELVTQYHPGLRHFIACSGRTGVPEFLLTTQDGLQHIVHTLSRSGALHDIGNADLPSKFPVLNENVSPGRVAQNTLVGPWAPEWVANMVDEKPIPFEVTENDKQYGRCVEYPRYRRTYLGKNYGLASGDVQFGCVPIMAQWRREDKQVNTIQEMGTLLLRCGLNDTIFPNPQPGWVPAQGMQAALQQKNKLLVVTSPYDPGKPVWESGAKGGIRSAQSTIALYNYERPQPSWEIYVEGRRVTKLPYTCKQGQRIIIKDGVTYLGIIPLPSTDLGRDAEVVIGEGTEQQAYGGYTVKAALTINSYMLKRAAPVADLDPAAVDRAYGGFVVEFGDSAEYPDFATFQKHMNDTKVDVRLDPAQPIVHATYWSGIDTLEMGARTDYTFDEQSDKCFAYRRVNAKFPYLPAGIDRDTNLTQLGTTGRLEKNGAVLTCEPGVMAYLMTEPISGTYCGFNPLPDPTCWSLQVPTSTGSGQAGTITIKADGRLGLARVAVRPKENSLWLEYGVKADQHTADMASALLVFGLPAAPKVYRENVLDPAKIGTVALDGKTAYVIPLEKGKTPKELAARYARAEQLFTLLTKRSDLPVFVQDWYIAGPFFNDFLGKGFSTVFPPETTPGQVKLDAVYTSTLPIDGKDTPVPACWTRTLTEDGAPLGAAPLNLLPLLKPNRAVTAYAYTKITSDRERDVILYTGSDESIAVWLNGAPVLTKKIYRAALKDQDKTPIHLRKGENTVLVKLSHGYEAWHLYFRLGDQYGFPVADGISYGFGK